MKKDLLKYQKKMKIGKTLMFQMGISTIALLLLVFYLMYTSDVIEVNSTFHTVIVIYFISFILGIVGMGITPDHIFTFSEIQKRIDSGYLKDDMLIFYNQRKFDDGYVVKFIFSKAPQYQISMFMNESFSEENFPLKLAH